MKKFGIFVLIVFSVLWVWGDNLVAVSGTGTQITASDTYSDVASTSSLDVTNVDKVLVYATFTSQSTQATGLTRVMTYQITDDSVTPQTSSEIQRYLQQDRTGDKGVGSLSYIFDTSSLTGNKTYKLQHRVTRSTDTQTTATIVAIALTTNSSPYPTLSNDMKTITTGVTTTSTTFTAVSGLTTSGVTLATDGDILTLASINTGATVGTDITGQWTVQRSPNGIDSWTSVGQTMSRTMSNDSDLGIANITHLDDGLAAGTYYYRLAHKTNSGTIQTSNTSLAVIALGYLKGGTEVRYFEGNTTNTITNNPTSSTTAVNVASQSITADGSSAFIAGQFGVSTVNSETANYALSSTGGVLTASTMQRFLDDGDSGSGAIAGLVTGLTASTGYTLNMQHFSTGGEEITSSAIEFLDVQLTDTYVEGVLPVTLSHFSAAFIGTTPVIAWTTQSESGNAGWNVYRGATQDALQNGEVTLLNSGLIDGAGSTSEPTNYTFSDEYAYNTNTTYYYWLESVSVSGVTENHGSVQLYIPQSDPGSPAIPEEFGLYQNYPNPFNPTTTISFSVPSATRATVTIYNAKGGKVAEVFNGIVPAKEVQSILWDGTDSFGKPVTSGIYLYKMHTEKETLTKRMMLLK